MSLCGEYDQSKESTMTTLEILENARDLIRNERNWFGRGEGFRFDDNPRTQNCTLTACCMGGNYSAEVPKAWQAVLQAIRNVTGHGFGMIAFNESHTHPEVLEVFNVAIANELAKQQEWQVEEEPLKVRMATYTGDLEPAVA